MAQDAVIEILRAAERVNQASVGSLRHGVHREVATRQVLFERDIRARFSGEACVTGPRLTLSTSKRVFLPRDGMQKNREVFADRPRSPLQHVFWACPDDHPVAITGGFIQ